MFKKMKKFIVVLFIFTLTQSLFCNALDISWDIGDVFLDGNFVLNEKVKPTLEAGATLGELEVTDSDTSLSCNINPFYWNCVIANNTNQKTENRFSFLNLELFYDFLHFNNKSIRVGPYISANYLDLVNMNFTNYDVSIGFKFMYFWKDIDIYYFKPETLSVRTGFRIRDNLPSFFIEGRVNLGGLIFSFISDSYEDAKIMKDIY